ncbi:N-acetylmuramoyl-L-alanine amidase [Solibacillus sp. FSL H8-0538]|uniref:N-acetylmuramoyl-L-alanine amidase n=1 Tax=Solibacillus sp. FSL H8-0538 TaxID=2921400 RepID=UPI0030FB1995
MRKVSLQLLMSCVLIFLVATPSFLNEHVFADDGKKADLVVSAEILHLREGPGLSYPIIETLKDGQALRSIEQQGDWIHVQVGDLDGWVASWLTQPSAQEVVEESQKSIISQVDHLNVRSEPSLSAAVLTQLSSGTEAVLIKQQQDWIQIQYGDFIGWVSAIYVTINDNILTSTETETETDTDTDTEEVPPEQPENNLLDIENDPNTFMISVNAVNIRKKADLTSKKLGVGKKGQQFKVVSRNNNWVQIEYTNKKKGWVYSFYGTFAAKTVSTTADESAPPTESVTIIYNGTNLRENASTSSNVVTRVNAGETFTILATEGEWYKIDLGNNQVAYVANWVVTNSNSQDIITATTTEPRKKGTLQGVTIVLDPGHGGNDHGTTGNRGTAEKEITTKTAELLKSKLRAAGADVILTRESDVYVDLRKRVAIAHQSVADAFVSIHYDAIEDTSVTGFTTYYTNSYQKNLAEYVHSGLATKVSIRDRGVRAGNYLVLRENRQNAILIELGYLSNPNEERTIATDYYREQATLGIYQGLLNYFDAQLTD